jgi:hypothetical protein
MRFKLSAVIPVVQYGNIQPEIELEGDNFDELKKEATKYIENLWSEYGEKPMKNVSEFKEYKTFTGETVLYDDKSHSYTDLNGKKLISGSEFSKRHQKPFDREMISGMVSKKHKVPKESILDMWDRNSEISTTFGTSLHLAMEQWFLNKENGTENEYHLPKPQFLKDAVLSFPLKDEIVIPEAFVSDVENKMVGQVDGLVEVRDERAIPEVVSYRIIDYKSDSNIKKNIGHHALQLNFYRTALENKDVFIEGMEIWNYAPNKDGNYEWVPYTIENIDINLEEMK